MSRAMLDVELVIQAGIGRMDPEMAARATLTLDAGAMSELIEKIRVDAYEAGYLARQRELEEEADRDEREFEAHAQLVTRICELPDRDRRNRDATLGVPGVGQAEGGDSE